MSEGITRAPEGVALDKNAVNASTPDQTVNSSQRSANLRRERWAAREVARRLTHRANVAKCGHTRMRSFVELRLGDDRASYGGLVTCGAVWLCPVCQAKIAAHRALEVAAVTEWAEREGIAMYFGALTVQHGPDDALSVSLDTLRTAWREMTRNRGWQNIVDAAGGEVRFVRALEINIGANGWHPHQHPLVLLPAASTAADSVAAAITARWRECVERAGGQASSAAQRLERVERAGDVGMYITDQTYGGKGARVDLEMTSSQNKRGITRAEGTRSHWSILEDLALGNADNAHYVSMNEVTTIPSPSDSRAGLTDE